MEILKNEAPEWLGPKWDMLKIDSSNGDAVISALKQGFEPFAVCALPSRSSAFANEMLITIFVFMKRQVPNAQNSVG